MEVDFKDIVIGNNRDPQILFKFEGLEELKLDKIIFDGCTSLCPMLMYQDIIDFCKIEIEKIPHFDAVDGKLEWVNNREENHETKS